MLFVRPTHSQRLERWLGPAAVEEISRAMRTWYGPPIPVAGVPGSVWACGDGDFRGPIASGQYMHALDFVESRIKRIARNFARHQQARCNAGFASLSDLIAEATAGKRREFSFRKTGASGAIASWDSLWRVGTLPPAGAASSAAPGGIALTDATTGAFPFTNPTGGDTQHFVFGASACDVVFQNMLLYDRIFGVAKTINSTATEAVTGVPTRYQNTVAGSQDSAEGNFLFVEIGTTLAAVAHNHTVCLYTDEAGGASTLPSIAGISAGGAERLDFLASWFMPLASGDRGIQTLTQMQTDALVTSGAMDFVIGHPLAWFTNPVANMIAFVDGINTAFNLVRIFDDAALAFLVGPLASTSTSTYSGSFTTVAG